MTYYGRMDTSVKTCSICQDELKDPRLLPCIHSFCLECLEQYCADKLPGDDVPCPECRNEFSVPKTGVAGLTARTHSKEAGHLSVCEQCVGTNFVGHVIPGIGPPSTITVDLS